MNRSKMEFLDLLAQTEKEGVQKSLPSFPLCLGWYEIFVQIIMVSHVRWVIKVIVLRYEIYAHI